MDVASSNKTEPLIPHPDSKVEAARWAFHERNVQAAKAIHQAASVRKHDQNPKRNHNISISPSDVTLTHGNAYSPPMPSLTHSEKHKLTSSEYLKAFIFGGLDGIVTIFAIVAGSVGARLNPMQIIIIGLGNLLADAVSMAFGEYVSAKAEKDFVNSEKDREEWEVRNCPEEEKNEMLQIYTDRYGFTLEDAKDMVDITFKYPRFFIQHMMVEELGLMIGDDGPTPFNRGAVMFISFCVFGLVPLGGFIGCEALIGRGRESIDATDVQIPFLLACLVSLCTLFVLGFFKGRFVCQNANISGVLMTLNGTLAGIVAFAIGDILQKYVGVAV